MLVKDLQPKFSGSYINVYGVFRKQKAKGAQTFTHIQRHTQKDRLSLPRRQGTHIKPYTRTKTQITHKRNKRILIGPYVRSGTNHNLRFGGLFL